MHAASSEKLMAYRPLVYCLFASSLIAPTKCVIYRSRQGSGVPTPRLRYAAPLLSRTGCIMRCWRLWSRRTHPCPSSQGSASTGESMAPACETVIARVIVDKSVMGASCTVPGTGGTSTGNTALSCPWEMVAGQHQGALATCGFLRPRHRRSIRPAP